MGVIHESARRLGYEFICERLSRLDWILCNIGYAIHRVGDLDPVPVDCRWVRQFVLDYDLDLVALGDADHRPGNSSVISEGGH